jgi:3',5'-cyclic AMP phosphodiesterase CpdA
MRQIAHISDLHFGTEEPVVADGLLEDLAARSPHLVAVSGDLTQRARAGQFVAAAKFLQQIAKPLIVVPGNHDIPLYNIVARFFFPLAGYTKFITPDLQPHYQDVEMSVVGVNTARSNTWKNGRISHQQIAQLQNQFAAAASRPFKVLVAHHPFIPPESDGRAALVGRLSQALDVLEQCGCDLILAGHLHQAYSGSQPAYHLERKRSILIAQAGTAISHRRRNEPNSYNYIEYDADRLTIEVRGWNGNNYETVTIKHFQRHDRGWEICRP